ncbi:alpha-L-fucosidase [Catalinimonas sp. 4WD22]|uniref:alpha-L-fucosidase n=1 Tax=Catalinimonas locisalis TaxID=3133978 RepID=UPI003100EBA0
MRITLYCLLLSTFLAKPLSAQEDMQILNLNKPEREQWFTDLGFGMFIHWSVDAQLGSVISHSMVGASEDFINRYIEELPKTFNPQEFEPAKWAVLAKLAGMKYVVFTAKHHNGFCMYDTETTDFNIMNTPFGRDATLEVLDAFRKEGIAVGLYFSPDDFYFLHQQGLPISRQREAALPSNNPELLVYDKKQLRELLTNYGKIEMVFIDGIEQYGETELAKLCWEIDPDIVVTRGAIQTPEQNIPNEPLPSPWEACYTMGTQWQFKPTNETYKSGTEIINNLIEIRAKGGNWLLNIGPKPDGTLPEAQEDRLREVALWNFVNQEALNNIEPWNIIREGDIWFTKAKNQNMVYAFITHTHWPYGERKTFQLRSVKGNENTKVSILGHGGEILEYQPEIDATPYVYVNQKGVTLDVMRAQRLYNDKTWPNPVVVKIENVEFQNP